MRRILPQTFLGQLVLGTVLSQTLLLGVFVWWTIVSQQRTADARASQRLTEQMERLSVECARLMARQDSAELQHTLQLALIAPSINEARLTTVNGQTIAASHKEHGGAADEGLDESERAVLPGVAQPQVFKIKTGQMEAVTPVVVAGTTAALLWLEPDHDLAQTTPRMVVRVCVTYGGFALLANLLPIFLMVRTMTRPLRVLREATQSMMQNSGGKVSFPLPVTSHNEAGELTMSFNAMVQELETQRTGLLETLALLDSMLGNAPIGFGFFDRELQYVRVNDFLANAHGSAMGQHIGRRVSDFYLGELAKTKESCIEQVFRTGEAISDVQLTGEMMYAPGVRRNWQMHFYPVRIEDGAVKWVGVIVVETTEQLKAEETLRKTEKLAAAGRLAASIAHEINNPLESVMNLLYLLGTHEPMDALASNYIATAQAELSRVSEITQQTLRFYRQSTSRSATDVVEVLDSILLLYQGRLMASRITVKKRAAEPLETMAFSGELRQLLANLVGNSVDAMAGGGCLTLTAKRGHGRDMDGEWCEGVRIGVSDTGHGMPEETRRKIFEAFFTTKESTGTGLGLWVSDEIVRKHRGRMWVRSTTGEKSGTMFLIFLPDVDADAVKPIAERGRVLLS